MQKSISLACEPALKSPHISVGASTKFGRCTPFSRRCAMVQGLGGGCGGWGVGCGAQGLGFRVRGEGFGAQGVGFRVQGVGFRVLGSGSPPLFPPT